MKMHRAALSKHFHSQSAQLIPAVKASIDELDQWAPDTMVSVDDIKSIVTCGLCKSYFMNAATITECMHTFCKACIVLHTARSLHCPVCETLIHPTDPFVNLRLDSTMQDIVYKMFPQSETDERQKEKIFYRSRGLPYPPPAHYSGKTLPKKRRQRMSRRIGHLPPVKMISVLLEYAGITPGYGPYQPLLKNYLRVPENTTISTVQSFIRGKMGLKPNCRAVLLVNMCMVHDNMPLQHLLDLYDSTDSDGDSDEDEMERSRRKLEARKIKSGTGSSDMIVLQYGIVPNQDYFAEDRDIDAESLKPSPINS